MQHGYRLLFHHKMLDYLTLALVIRISSSLTVKIGLISPKDLALDTVGFRGSAGAVNISKEKAEKLLSGIHIEFKFRDDHFSPKYGISSAYELIEEGVSVIIGSPVSAVSEAIGYVTAFRNVLHISWGAEALAAGNKSAFPTLIRTYTPLHGVTDMLSVFFRSMGWTILGALMEDSGHKEYPGCEHLKDALRHAFEVPVGEDSVKLSKLISYPSGDRLTGEKIDSYLQRLSDNARVIALCGSADNERQILIRAYRKFSRSDKFVFLLANHYRLHLTKPWQRGDADDSVAKQAYGSVIYIDWAYFKHKDLAYFEKTVIAKTNAQFGPPKINLTASYAVFLHDAVYMYLMAVRKARNFNRDLMDGREMFRLMKTLKYYGMSGKIAFDKDGDRLLETATFYSLDGEGNFQKVAEMSMNKKEFVDGIKPKWILGGSLPADRPLCGFHDVDCKLTTIPNAALATVLVAINISVLLLMCLRTPKSCRSLPLIFQTFDMGRCRPRPTWLIDYADIEDKNAGHHERSSSADGRATSLHSLRRRDSVQEFHKGQYGEVFGETGVYKDQIVSLKRMNVKKLALGYRHILELNELTTLKHGNINPFVGVCVQSPNFCLVYWYGKKGSLEDILDEEKVNIGWLFQQSFLEDIAQGMNFIHHNTSFGSHGRLKSSNCIVDSRWVLKITDYGMVDYRIHEEQFRNLNEDEKTRDLLWVAPELLRKDTIHPRGSQKGDVYSFAIILHEIMFRAGPFGNIANPSILVAGVRKTSGIVIRPILYANDNDTEEDTGHHQIMESLMVLCWSEDPDDRPTFKEIVAMLAEERGSDKDRVSNLLKLMRKYAEMQEQMVEARTEELNEEKKKTDTLLGRLLPKSVAESLIIGKDVDPECFRSVTIFFSDIKSFTVISSESTPLEIVNMLNKLYTLFDSIIDHYDVYKVETIGDAYMVVSGLPILNGDRHAAEIANMSLEIRDAIAMFVVPHKRTFKLQLRIGIHTGSVCAGIVGHTRPRYCLLGESVNISQSLESMGKEGEIHLSSATNDILQKLGGYVTERRGVFMIQDRPMVTFWLLFKQ